MRPLDPSSLDGTGMLNSLSPPAPPPTLALLNQVISCQLEAHRLFCSLQRCLSQLQPWQITILLAWLPPETAAYFAPTVYLGRELIPGCLLLDAVNKIGTSHWAGKDFIPRPRDQMVKCPQFAFLCKLGWTESRQLLKKQRGSFGTQDAGHCHYLHT